MLLDLKSFKRIALDIETNGLLQHLVDFNKMPLVLNTTAKLWLIVLTDVDNPENNVKLKLQDCTLENMKICFKNCVEIVFHNGVKFDAFALKLFKIFDYKIYSYPDMKGNNGEVFGNPVKITDTLILSKVLSPDRWFGHSLDAWGKQIGDYKEDYRQICIDKGYIDKNSPKGAEFAEYYPEIIPYCVQDTKVTILILIELLKEKTGLNIDFAYHMELKIADLTVKQEFYGFSFNKELAEKNVSFLNQALEERRNLVNPLLPPKKLNKTEAKSFYPPKRQFKQNGDITADLIKFLERLGASINEDKTVVTYEGRTYNLPLDTETCLKETIDADIEDLNHVKYFLITQGWIPTEWVERDLTRESGKKARASNDKIKDTIDRYVADTLNSLFKNERLNILDTSVENLSEVLHSKIKDFSIRVPVSPAIKVGTAKRMCPNLESLGEKAEFVKYVIEYLTYKHRRNSIAGGADDETGEPSSGYLTMIEENGRIRTPADTLGANCLTADTRLITDSGLKYITEVNKGDLVLTHTGVYQPVIDTINNGVKPVFLVKLENGCTIKCTENHPFFTDSGWVVCKDLKTGTQVYTYSEAETWTTWDEYPNYRFSSFGKIVNMDGFELRPNLRLESRKKLWERGKIDLYDKNGVPHKKRIGRFIYFAFNPNDDYSLEVLHNDGNPTNNNLNNLRLGTSKQNSEDAELHGFTQKIRLRSTVVLTAEKVKEIREKYAKGNVTHQQLSQEYKVSRRHIGDIISGKRWTNLDSSHYDYKASFNLSPVSIIVELSPEPTYDVTVEEDHSYISNSIVTHNTGRYRHIGVANIPRVTSLFGLPMRSMFGPGKGRIEFGLDWSAVEARVQGHYVYKYKQGPELAAMLIADKPNSIHCLSSDTQILTDSGWIDYKSINLNTLVCQWSKIDNSVTFVNPTEIIRRNHTGNMIHIEGERIDHLVSPEHRIVLYNDDTETYVDVLAKDLHNYSITNPNCFIPASGNNLINDTLQDIIDYYLKDCSEDFEFINCKTAGYFVGSYDKDLIDHLQEDLFINDCVALINIKNTHKGPLYQTLIPRESKNLKGHYLKHTTITEVPYTLEDKTIWCVSVPSTYIVTRRNNKINISGNCVNARKMGITRDQAKTFGYSVLYGAGPPKLAKSLGVTLEEAKNLYKAYWDGLPGMMELKEKVEAYWDSTGKKNILAIDGRPLFVRSKHSLINLLFQSAGALLVKYALLEVCSRLEVLDLLGDPFVDSENAEKVFLMITYHDEYQMSCPESMFKIHKCATEEEAKALGKLSKSGSPSHVGEEYWVAEENILSTIFDESVELISSLFKLNTSFGVEWQVGTNWGNCH